MAPKLPGQLGDPEMSLLTDPRANRDLLAGLKAVGMAEKQPPAPMDRSCSEEELLGFCKFAHEAFTTLYENNPFKLPGDEKYKSSVEEKIIPGGDGQDMKLFIFRPEGAKAGPLPCVIYYHGGGMVMITTDNPCHRMWCHDMATSRDGMVVVMPDFRNCYDAEGHKFRPFPTGLNDCVAAAKWVAGHKAELGISKIVFQGESGGGNLSIATALKLKQEGKGDLVDGVYALCPYISGAYGWPAEKLAAELPSLIECNGYIINRSGMDLYVKAYDPEDKHRENPLAWPYHASEAELKGLPPVTVVVDELDPLRDEGIAFARKLDRAGVRVVPKMNFGTTHGGPELFRQSLPEMRFSTVNDLNGFARRL